VGIVSSYHYQKESLEYGIDGIKPIESEVIVNANKKEGSSAKLSVVAAVIGGNIQSDVSS